MMTVRFLDARENEVGVAVAAQEARAPGVAYCSTRVSELVRQAILNGWPYSESPASPLVGLIRPGATVLLKPNWVLHYNQSGGSMDCMVTHRSFILAVLGEVVKARPGRIVLGDAPIQMADWAKLVPEWFMEELQRVTCPVQIDVVDFRGTIIHEGDLVHGLEKRDSATETVVSFDLGRESLLEPICRHSGQFRNTCYDAHALATTHRPGCHQYLLRREALEADVILNLPKLKTHRKAGLTAALKNLVGVNADKDYLPHHRVGGSAWGGDCYPGLAPLKRLAEFCLDLRNQHIGSPKAAKWTAHCDRILRLHGHFGDCEIEGSWYGNDTIWRMVLDLNRLLLYGRADGSLADIIQRQVYTLTDGIIAGQGQGPLAPEPLDLGVVTFATSSAFADLVHAGLLGMDYRQIPLVREAFGRFRYPLTDGGPEKCSVRANGIEMNWSDAAEQFGKPARPPHGWVGHVELRAVHSQQAAGCS